MSSNHIKGEASYLSLGDHTLVGIGRARFADGAIVAANPTIARVFGFDDVDEFVQVFKISENYVNPAQRKELLSELKDNGVIHNAEIEFYRRDGTTIWLMTSIRYLEEEEINEFLAIDVTSYKRQQEEFQKSRAQTEHILRAQKAQMDGVLRNIADGILVMNSAYQLVLANPKALDYLGVLKSTLSVGDTLTTLGDRPIAEFLEPPPSDTLSHEVFVQHPEARVFEVEAQPMQVADNDPGWTLILRDLTQKKTVQKHNETQARLAAIGQLVAGIAHDFNNILFGMMGYTQLLQRMPDMPEAALQRLNKILIGGEQASDMIKQLLDFSRTSPSIQEPTSLTACVKAAVSLIKRVLPGNIEIRTEYEPGDFLVQANKTQLIQMLTRYQVME